MPVGQPNRIIIGNPGFPVPIAPNQSLEREVDADQLVGLHEWRARFGVAKNQYRRRPQRQPSLCRACGMVDAREQRQAVRLDLCFETRDGFRWTVTAFDRLQTNRCHCLNASEKNRKQS